MARFKRDTDVNAVAANPTKFFKNPHEVLIQPELTRGDKLKILRQWEVDARLLEVAEEENMDGGETDQLAAIVSALIALDDEGKRPDAQDAGSPAKHGG